MKSLDQKRFLWMEFEPCLQSGAVQCIGTGRKTATSQVMSPVNYQLELPMQWSIHPVFYIDLLTPYCMTPTHGPNYQQPPPSVVMCNARLGVLPDLGEKGGGGPLVTWWRRLYCFCLVPLDRPLPTTIKGYHAKVTTMISPLFKGEVDCICSK